MTMSVRPNGDNRPLPYTPLPPQAEDAALDSMVRQGFVEDAILREFRYSRAGGNDVKVNAYAFAHPKHRILSDYGSFTVYNATNGASDDTIVRILAESYAPFHLIHRDGRFNLLGSTATDSQDAIRHISIRSGVAYDELAGVLAELRADLNPQRIMNVKQGRDEFSIFRDIRPLQMSLFALEATRELLQDTFANTVEVLRSFESRQTPRIAEHHVRDLAVQLLGAAILADTGVLGDKVRRPEAPPDLLIDVASKRYDRYFDARLFYTYREAVHKALSVLRGVSYAGFVPSMLTELYLAAYTAEERRELGGYNTPLYLTRRIWEMIPVEFLPRDQRLIADISCGWGSFLIAGHERLDRMGDMRGETLRDYVHGTDKDDFAARLAGLGLLVSTSEDSWHISHFPAREWPWLEHNQPNVIVGNPPFSENRKNPKKQRMLPEGERPRRVQMANEFLQYAIERLAPNGYLAMLMPRSFVASQASSQARKELVEQCDILEVWELPPKVFAEAEAAAETVAIFAQKKNVATKATTEPVRIRILQNVTLPSFKKSMHAVFTASTLKTDPSTWNADSRRSPTYSRAHIFDYRSILPEYTWKEITDHCELLADWSIIFNGCKEGQTPARKRHREYADQRSVPYLPEARKNMPGAWAITYGSDRRMYPNEFEEPRLNFERYFVGDKVLVNAATNPSWGRRITAAIDRRGYYVSGSFWVLVPTPEAVTRGWNHEVIAAVLNWYVSNAWIVEGLKLRWIERGVLANLPIPRNLGIRECEELTRAVHELENAAHRREAFPEDAVNMIDHVLQDAYRLDNATVERLRRLVRWGRSPDVTLDLQPAGEAQWLVSGYVHAIDPHRGTLTIWLDEFDELQIVPIVPWMPGWMLRPGAQFRTRMPRSKVRTESLNPTWAAWGIFEPQPNAWMDEEDVVAELSPSVHQSRR